MELAMLRESMQKLAPSSLDTDSAANALAITPVSSGVPSLDKALILGGLPAGRVTEIAGPSSSGKTALGLRLLAEQTSQGKLVAFVDGTGQFYPPSAAAMGIDLARMLLIAPLTGTGSRRCHQDDGVLALARATEIITRSRAFSMVLLDLPQAARVQRTPARRLRVAAQATGTTIIALGSRNGDVEGAAARIQTRGCKRKRTQLHIVKGAGQHSRSTEAIEFACKQHRFDDRPPCEVAPIQSRALPGEEAASYRSARSRSRGHFGVPS